MQIIWRFRENLVEATLLFVLGRLIYGYPQCLAIVSSKSARGPSINYVSIFEGGGGLKMLMVAYVRGLGVSIMLT